jgi:hypothetical protein
MISGCGPAQTTRQAPATQKAEESPAERLARVRRLAIAGPEAKGAPEELAEALDTDDDLEVRKVAFIGLLSFGEKTVRSLPKPGWKISDPDVPTKAPNPKKAPEEMITWIDKLVGRDPYFAGALFVTCVECTHDDDPAIRLVSVRAITNLMNCTPEQLANTRKAAQDPKDLFHKKAEYLLQQRAALLEAIRKLIEDRDEKVSAAAKGAVKQFVE